MSGADSLSPEEAHQVAALVRALVESGSTWVDRDGVERPLGYGDVLMVAPYNAQVGAIAALLPPDARVGTVDKFQGQEAPVSIYSMTSSSPEDAPRGMDFLYSRNRLNVATSRARCVAVVVASRRSSAFAPARRSRCGWRTLSASSPRWRPGNPADGAAPYPPRGHAEPSVGNRHVRVQRHRGQHHAAQAPR